MAVCFNGWLVGETLVQIWRCGSALSLKQSKIERLETHAPPLRGAMAICEGPKDFGVPP